MTGPTVEGSIVANVKADISNLEENVTRAQAKLEELTGKKTEVTVGANTLSAQAQMRALQDAVDKVATAETRLQAAERASQNAASQSYVANLRLEREMSKRGRTELSVAAATEASARADRNAESAELRRAAATEVLTSAQLRLKAVSDAVLAGGSQSPQEPKPSASNAGSNGAGYAQTALIAVAALLPIVAALAGYVAAVTGSFAGMGAAGVLAVLGIKNAMADGTAAGNVFSGGLHILKGDLDSLSATAANAMLQNFQLAVSQIDAALPSLNGEIKVFSDLLGATGNIVLSALISGFHTLLPLFAQAGVYIEQVAVGFQKWTTGGGLASWARDASVALPQVATALGSLVHGVVSVIGALQPLGSVMLGTITIVGNVLTVLSGMGPVLPVVAAGALAAVGAFMGWRALTPVIVNVVSAVAKLPQTIQDLTGRMVAWLASTSAQTVATVEQTVATEALAVAETDAAVATDAVSIATKAALGPVGVILAIVSAVAVAFMTASAATNNATDATNNYTAAIQQDNGVIGKNTEAQVANNLQKQGAFDAATKLGIATKTLTDATLGNAAAHSEVTAALDKQTKKLDAQVAASSASAYGMRAVQLGQQAARSQIENVTSSMKTELGQIKERIKAYNEIAAAQGLTSIATRAQLVAQSALAASYGDSLPVYLAAQSAQKQTEDQLKATTAAMVQENDASSLLTNALTLLNGGSLSVAQAQTGLSAANNSLIDSFRQNGKVVDGSTKAAVSNQQAIQQQVQAAQQAAEAIGKSTGSSNAAVAAYKASKDAIEAQLKAQGDLTPAVQAYIDKLYDVANLKVPPTKLDVDTAAAVAKLAAWKTLLKNVVATEVVGLDGSIHFSTGAVARAGGGVTGPGELTLVGERGPEYARFPAGTTIYPNGVKPALSPSRITNSQTTNNEGAQHTTINAPMTTIVQADPQTALQDQFRRLNMLVR